MSAFSPSTLSFCTAMLKIGMYQLENNLILAPMAGVTDRPFRQLCKQFGAGLTVSEMVSSNPVLRNNRRTLLKIDHRGETEPRSVQIVGADPLQMAETARYNADQGAQIIDINMGCPAKKVCHAAAGSALMKDEPLVGRILESVVEAVDLPVTLKIRTGWDRANRNAVRIARIAEHSGIQAIAVHGRTRACGFSGSAEYHITRQVKKAVNIPVIANGDIDTPSKAMSVLHATGADAIMIGRAAQGKPWLFREINYFLRHGKKLAEPDSVELTSIVMTHLDHLYAFYGKDMGVRIARKHIGWYLKNLRSIGRETVSRIVRAESPAGQRTLVRIALESTSREIAA
jgi:tRNA-dihydrouridine synthase B